MESVDGAAASLPGVSVASSRLRLAGALAYFGIVYWWEALARLKECWKLECSFGGGGRVTTYGDLGGQLAWVGDVIAGELYGARVER